MAVEQLVDYRGFRVSMTQELPLSDNTLLYGSVDAGQTVLADPQVAACFVGSNIYPSGRNRARCG